MPKCHALTKDKKPCQIPTREGEKYCHEHKGQRRRKMLNWVMATGGFLLAILAVVADATGILSFLGFDLKSKQPIAAITVIAPSDTPNPPTDTPQFSTSTSTVSPLTEIPNPPTDTPQPLTSTSTVTPLTETPTIILTPSEVPNYLFNTDFASKEIPPGLNVESGKLFFNDKGMTTYGETVFSIGDSTWKNYKVELFISGVNTCDKGLDIGVRESSPGDMMVLVYRSCYVKWVNLKDGYTPMSNLDIPALDSRRIEITVKGNQYNSMSSVGTADHSTGGIYVTMRFDVTIEYIRVTKLDDIDNGGI